MDDKETLKKQAMQWLEDGDFYGGGPQEGVVDFIQDLIKNSGWLDMKHALTDGRAILVYATDQAYATPGGDNWHFYICPARWDGRMWSGWPLNTHYWPKAWKPLDAIGKFNPEPLPHVGKA